jgi:hypothetical protein
MGRPRKTDKRDRQLNIGLTNAEFDAVMSRAFARGMHAVVYARWMLLGRAKTEVHSVTPTTRFDRLAIVQLQRLGNLLNQIARHMHQTGQLPLDELVALLRDIRAVLMRGLEP